MIYPTSTITFAAPEVLESILNDIPGDVCCWDLFPEDRVQRCYFPLSFIKLEKIYFSQNIWMTSFDIKSNRGIYITLTFSPFICFSA